LLGVALEKDLVSIIVLNWNGKKVLKDCLDSIRAHTTYKKTEIIVVDQGSKDGSLEMMQNDYPEAKIIANPANVGIPKGTNQGFDKAKGEFVFLLSNDTIMTPGWLENALDLMKSNPRIASVGSTLISLPELGKILPQKKWKYRASPCSAAMLIKRKALDHIGYYDEANFSPYGGDETDWNLRAWNSGYKVAETQNSVVVHLGSVDTKRQNPNQYLLLNSNRLKAYLFNLSLFGFIKRLPGLGWIFLSSFNEGKTKVLLKSCLQNIKNIKTILLERKKRKDATKKMKQEQKQQGNEWF